MTAVDRDVLRELAARWMEIANWPVMKERKREWTALKDLHAERPMVLFETWTLENYVEEGELRCSDPAFRNIERHLRWVVRHAEEIGDDIVVEPCWRVGWHVNGTGYGVEILSHSAVDGEGGHVGYGYDHPIRTAADIDKLRPQTWSVNRDATNAHVETLTNAFGDILPVILHGTTSLHAGLTGDLFRLIGNDNLLTWVIDDPESIHRVMAYLRDDRLAYFAFLESERLLGANNNETHAGSGSPGYTTALEPETNGSVRLKDLWVWMESQETTCISPTMFQRLFLPYMAQASALFGLVYYGCCEPVHDRWDSIIRDIPNVRAVSISPWCDMNLMAEKLGRSVVFSRKPQPGAVSGAHADYEALGQDLDAVFSAARNCNLEIIFRDVYRIGGDRSRLRKWAEMARKRIG